MRRKRLAGLAGLLLLAGCGDGPRTIEIDVERSRFRPAVIRVDPGERVVFRLRNADPIAHEFIIGTKAEHAEHEHGTDPTHDGTAGAASLDPDEEQTVVWTAPLRGTLEFACHLPGHYAYGMKGSIEIG